MTAFVTLLGYLPRYGGAGMYTQHARARCQQRGVRPEVVNVILQYGERKRRHGADVCFMDKAAREKVWCDMGRKAYAKIADRLHAYLVVGHDDQITTVAKRFRRLVI